MLKFFRLLGKKRELTVAEKIAKAKEKYSDLKLVNKILEIEGLSDMTQWRHDSEFQERWYLRFVELCAEYRVDFEIPCGGPS